MPISRITTNSLENNAVNTTKVIDNTLTHQDLASNAQLRETQLELPLREKINSSYQQIFGNGSTIPGIIQQITDVTSGQFPAGSVDGSTLQDNTISGDKIINNSITNNKLSASSINLNNISSDIYRTGTWQCELYGSSLSTFVGGNYVTPSTGDNTLIDVKTVTYYRLFNFVYAVIPFIGNGTFWAVNDQFYNVPINTRINFLNLPFSAANTNYSSLGFTTTYSLGGYVSNIYVSPESINDTVITTSPSSVPGFNNQSLGFLRSSAIGGYYFPTRINNQSFLSVTLLYTTDEP
jgi:hypothetical protein